MPDTLTPDTPRSHPTAGVIRINLTMDLEAYQHLQQLAPTSKAYGRYLSQLVNEKWIRQDERQRLRKQLAAVIGEGSG